MCGEYDAARCTVKRWYEYLGTIDPDANLVPFQINYLSQPNDDVVNNFIPYNPRVAPCNETCACADCEAACPATPSKELKKNFWIFDMDGYAVIMAMIFTIGSGLFLIFSVCSKERKAKGEILLIYV